MWTRLTTRKSAGSVRRRDDGRVFPRNDFVRNDKGATAVEFALVAAPFSAPCRSPSDSDGVLCRPDA